MQKIEHKKINVLLKKSSRLSTKILTMSVAKTSERFESSSECFMCSSCYVWYTFNGKLVFSKMLSS